MAEKAKSVVVLESDEDFGGEVHTLEGRSPKKKKKKKKQDLKGPEKMVFKMAKQFDKATSEYRDRHEKSNEKKKNGWIKDLPKNYTKAASKLLKF
ncbi:hypothetical protein [Roseofilum capinflatum]|uniref:Uncharacterized protein n=1 Tax=Roseofilum capinflatum BLCC-M114 TaxID=3022440 RepID=A0ABT7B8Q3_9CYAN|nr:hypothetical protein [Roseofilum capinflatum]MDJ1175540.1 hypothetical protein [Roseofilum capinflatum BLCC-M114]